MMMFTTMPRLRRVAGTPQQQRSSTDEEKNTRSNQWRAMATADVLSVGSLLDWGSSPLPPSRRAGLGVCETPTAFCGRCDAKLHTRNWLGGNGGGGYSFVAFLNSRDRSMTTQAARYVETNMRMAILINPANDVRHRPSWGRKVSSCATPNQLIAATNSWALFEVDTTFPPPISYFLFCVASFGGITCGFRLWRFFLVRGRQIGKISSTSKCPLVLRSCPS